MNQICIRDLNFTLKVLQTLVVDVDVVAVVVVVGGDGVVNFFNSLLMLQTKIA